MMDGFEKCLRMDAQRHPYCIEEEKTEYGFCSSA